MATDTTDTTPLLLSLPPVLLTHILLYLQPRDIICAQALTIPHPALACGGGGVGGGFVEAGV